MAHFYLIFPLVPGPGEKEGSACLGTGTTGMCIVTSMAISIPPFPKVKWRVLWGLTPSMAAPLEESDYHDIAGQEGRQFSRF